MTKHSEPFSIPYDFVQQESSMMPSTRINRLHQNQLINTSQTNVENSQVITSIEEYHLQGVIGYGSSATVYSAIYLPQNHRVAIKMIDLDMFERNQIDELRRETALMALSKHENILPVYTSFVSGSKLCIVTPYLAGGSCLDIMKTAFPEGLDEISIATILKQALEGISYLHKNGHIHRDVKAGNLLVDEDGSVLLGDFGVSSSLMETGERGLRRTFVGTPCWMAPEVMEQAGYDYKADIWSFGITSIELATGQAPFAKLPPLKVLLMTLSNDPPSLIREGTKYKYSKVFKDMVDMCLNKEPINRPTAEKLLLHPFFKQARKKDYLVKTILSDLPPLERRSRKSIQKRQHSFTTSEEWDFNDSNDDYHHDTAIPSSDNDNNIENNEGHLPTVAHDSTGSDSSMNITSNNNNDNNNLTNDCTTPNDSIALPKSKRHISFGCVVVRNPPQPSSLFSTSQPTYSIIPDTQHSNISETSIRYTGIDDDCKKTTGISSTYPTSVKFSLDDQCNSKECHHPETTQPLEIENIGNQQSSTHQLIKTESNDSAGERHSRFEIQRGQNTTPNSNCVSGDGGTIPTTTAVHSHNMSSLTMLPVTTTSVHEGPCRLPISRSSSSKQPSTNRPQYTHQHNHSVGSDKEWMVSGGVSESRKIGRFELTTSTTSTTTATISESSYDFVPTRVSVERQSLVASPPSSSSSLSSSSPPPHNSTNSQSIPSHHHHHHNHQYHHHYHQQQQQHINNDIPYPSLSTTPPTSSSIMSGSKSSIGMNAATLQSHIEELLKYNETQRQIISDIFGSYRMERFGALCQQHKHTGSTSSNDDYTSMIDSLEKQLSQIGKENAALRMENRQLRKDLDQIRLL